MSLTLSTLARPMPSDGAVCLYATNLEVDIHNHDCLEAMHEQVHMYQSPDTGLSSFFVGCTTVACIILLLFLPILIHCIVVC